MTKQGLVGRKDKSFHILKRQMSKGRRLERRMFSTTQALRILGIIAINIKG